MVTEKRLIDANKLWNALPADDGLLMYQVKRAIRDAPTVDAVEVVRCEKCQHWNKRYETKGICLKHNSIVTFTSPDFYCACGERRTDHV